MVPGGFLSVLEAAGLRTRAQPRKSAAAGDGKTEHVWQFHGTGVTELESSRTSHFLPLIFAKLRTFIGQQATIVSPNMEKHSGIAHIFS